MPPTVTRDALVNFLVIGAQKAGTTALAHFLAQHPEICHSTKKELHFFDAAGFDDAESLELIGAKYHAEFPNYRGEKLVGESTPRYLFLPQVAERIFRYNPQAKLILLLRNPADRAISQYRMLKAFGRERMPILPALILEVVQPLLRRTPLRRKMRDRSYLGRGRYSQQILNLLRYFPREQLLILRSEELLNSHEATLTRIYAFLGVRNQSIMPPSKLVGECENPEEVPRWIKWLLRKWFGPEIARLEQLLQWDLQEWKEV